MNGVYSLPLHRIAFIFWERSRMIFKQPSILSFTQVIECEQLPFLQPYQSQKIRCSTLLNEGITVLEINL